MSEVQRGSAIALFHQDGKEAGVWYCSECRVVHKTEQAATQCHGVFLCECGKPVKSRYCPDCDECDRRKWQERMAKEERERFEKATKVKASEWRGEQVFLNDRYYESPEDAIDSCDQVPKYVWAAKDIGVPKADASDITDRLVAEMWEDADYRDLNGVEELQAAVDAFNEANKSIVVWMVDHSTAILIDREARRAD